MAANAPSTGWQRLLIGWGSLVLVVASLYWARGVLIPVVLAVLLTFSLSQPVLALQRRGLGRIPSVLLVVLLVSALLAGIGWAVAAQVQELVRELPNHRNTIKEKLASLQMDGEGGIFELFKEIGE